MRTDIERLRDMQENIRKIEEKIPDLRDAFVRSGLLMVWTPYPNRIIGEAANGMSPAFQESRPKVP